MHSSTYDMNNHRSIGNKRASTTTFALAKFLATTGPEEYPGHHNKIHPYDYYSPSDHPHPFTSTTALKPNLFDRLRKKTSLANTKHMQRHPPVGEYSNPAVWNTAPPLGKNSLLHRKYIPLIHDHNQPNLQNASQIPFYETKEENAGDTLPSFPTPPASSVHESVPDSAKKVIRGSRHVQVQTEAKKERCERCCRLVHPRSMRRDSCPAMLGTGAKLVHQKDLMGHEAAVLLALIEQLKQQLAEEQQSRKVLEKAIQLQWATEQN